MQDAPSPPPMFIPVRMRSRGPIAAVPRRLILEVDEHETVEPTVAVVPRTNDGDADLIAILDAPLAVGETAAAGFARKELEIRAALASRSVLAAHTLHKRLANPKPDDVLAQKFTRLTIDRRTRLLAFLQDARRRAALTGGR